MASFLSRCEPVNIWLQNNHIICSAADQIILRLLGQEQMFQDEGARSLVGKTQKIKMLKLRRRRRWKSCCF